MSWTSWKKSEGVYYDCMSKHYPSNTFTYIGATDKNSVCKLKNWRLPLPSTLPYTDEFEWSSEDVLTEMGQTIGSWIGSAANMPGAVGKAASGLHNILGGLDKLMGANGIVQKLANYKLDQSYNPNKMLFFTGPPHRNFSMSFDLVAESEDKAKEMADAVRELRLCASPGYVKARMFFDYPHFFTMSVVSHGTIVLERPCFVIKTINTNLSAGGGVTAFHKNAKPVSYTLEIQGIDAIIETGSNEAERVWLGEVVSGYDGKTDLSKGQSAWSSSLSNI